MSHKPTTGHVQYFNAEKHFGFVLGEDGQRYFAHVTQVQHGQPRLAVGQRVEFMVAPHPKGPRAQQIRILEAASEESPAGSTKDVSALPALSTSAPGEAASPTPEAPRSTAMPLAQPVNLRPLAELEVPEWTHSDMASLRRMLGAFMGFGPETASFSLGNTMVRTPAFRDAARELSLRAEGRIEPGGAPRLALTVADLLAAHHITHGPQLAAKLDALERVLVPFFKLVIPHARPEIHRAMIEVFRSAVRAALWKPRQTRSATPSEGQPPTARGASLRLSPQSSSATDKGEDREATMKAGVSPAPTSLPAPSTNGSARNPPSVSSAPRQDAEPQTGEQAMTPPAAALLLPPRSLVQAVAQHRFQTLDLPLSGVRSLLDKLQPARMDFRIAPLDFGAGAQLVRFLEEVKAASERALAVASELMASTQEAAAHHVAALGKVDALMQEAGFSELPSALMEQLVRPSGSTRVAQLMSAAALSTSNVPQWLLARWFGGAASLVERVDALLRQPGRHTEVVAVVDWLTALPPPSRQLLPACEVPQDDTPVLDALKVALDVLLERQRDEGQWRARLGPLRNLISDALFERLGAERNAAHETLLARTEMLVRRVQALAASLGGTAYEELRAALHAWPENDLPATIEEVEFAVERLKPELSCAQPSLAMLTRLAEILRAPESKPAVPAERNKSADAPPEATGVSVDHPLSRVTNGRTITYSASLVWVPIADQGIGILRFPVRLKLDKPMEREAEWVVEVTTELSNSVPEQWRRQYPTSLPLQVPARATYKDFTVEVPVTRHNADLIAIGRRNLSLQFAISRGPHRVTSSLHWQGLERELPKYVSPLPITATRKEMDRHPLGVEREFARLRDLVAQGRKSFRVHGPRRMGKTTVIRALREYFAKSPSIYVLESVVASQYQTAAEVWDAVGQRLSQAFNRPVNLGKVFPPPEEAFNAVREAAREQGYSAIYVIIDEAQALFTLSGEPQRLGEALKARLESEWAQVSEQRAALLLGLVGQAHLPELMGGNLLGAISDAVTADGIRADELLQLLRTTQGEIGLQSTTEAREALARQAGNLWILGSLLDRVATNCLGEGRPWFTEEDVERAVQRLVEADDAGTETTLWSYVRDVLNDSDDKNVWRPSETYPVAMAWAHVCAMGGELPRLRADKVEFIHLTLQDWSRTFDIQKQRVEEAFGLLQRQRVLRKNDSFDLPLLERLLLARANGPEPLSEEVDRRSLNRLGMRRLVTPPSQGTENTSGGQASVYEGLFNGKSAAVRRVRLTDSKAEQRFIREVTLLERLSGASGDASREAQPHLPRLFGTGIDPAAPEVGLVVYEWVVGTPLEARQLTANGSLLVLQGLTRALRALGHSGIVHRDIRPANVLIRQNKGEPVLIDFGLSVAVDEVSRTTALAGVVEFLPPEVKERGASAWSHAGDMYSVGRTLTESLAVPDAHDAELKSLLDAMTASAPDARPTPETALELIETLLAKRQVRQRMEELRQSFTDALSSLAPSLREAASASMAEFVAAKSGMVTPKMRLLRASEFLENLVQAKVRLDYRTIAEAIDSGPGRTFLKVLGDHRSRLPPGLRPLADCEAAISVGELRNAAAHPAEAEDIIRRAHRQLPHGLKNGRPLDEAALMSAFRKAVETVADHVATLIAKPEVRSLVRKWVEA